MTRHVHALDWSRTVAYAATPSSQGINIVDRAPRQRGADARGRPREARRRRSPRACARSRRPHDGAAAGRGGVDARAGVLRPLRAARPRPLAGARRRRHDVDPALRDGRRPPPASRAAITAGRASSSPPGPGIRAGASVEELSIVDVAPLLLHQLGLPAPEDMAGQRPGGDLRARRARAAPARAASPAPAARGARREPRGRRRARARGAGRVMERLRALGYVE